MHARLAAARAATVDLDEKAKARLARDNKLHVRERIALLFDPDTFVEDGRLANAVEDGLPADGVVTGQGLVGGRPALVMANDPTVKAGSWGARTVEKIIRLTEKALATDLPVFWFVDSAGARITDQVQLFPGRRGAGRIFHNQVRLSGRAPQICCLFGPSAAGGAYIPSFCDVVFMVERNASMYLGSPRMAEEVINEHVSLEEMGGARMHATVSGCGDNLAVDDADAIEAARQLFSYLPTSWEEPPPPSLAAEPAEPLTAAMIPTDEKVGYDVHRVIDGIADADSFFEIKPLFAPELVTGFARLAGNPVGIVANNPAANGGVLFVDSADKAARFIWMCDAYNVPLVYLADVPGFMIGTEVERQGIIRHGAKMITAVSEATVPTVSVILRKAYGAGLYAMCGPAFSPDACLALPTAEIAVMGAEPAVNAVFANQIAAIDDPVEREPHSCRPAATSSTRTSTSSAWRATSSSTTSSNPRTSASELIARLALAASKDRGFSRRRHGVPPGLRRGDRPATPPYSALLRRLRESLCQGRMDQQALVDVADGEPVGDGHSQHRDELGGMAARRSSRRARPRWRGRTRSSRSRACRR